MSIDWSAIEWGTAGEWVAAIGTVGALLLGLWLLQRERRDAQRAQAQQVHAIPVSWKMAANPTGRSSAWVRIKNTSTQPVYEASVGIAPDDTASPTWTGLYGVIEGESAVTSEGPEYFGPMTRGRVSPRPAITLRFTDAAGRRWQREPDGTLRSVSPRQARARRRRDRARLEKMAAPVQQRGTT